MIKNFFSLNQLFEKGVKSHLEGNYSDALILYKQLLKIKPNFAEAYNNIGLIYNEFGDKDKALDNFLKAIKINPNFFEAHNNLGGLFIKLKNYSKAVSHCKKAIDIQPRFAKAYNHLGRAYDEIGDLDNAVKYYKKSIKIEPNLIEAHNNLGSIFKEMGKYEHAINYYKKAIEIKDDYSKARKNLGLVFLLLSNFRDGFEEFEWRIKENTKKEYEDIKMISPLWKGENLNGKKILILSEQGIGDTIQFTRYIYQLKETYDVKIIFRIQKKFIHLCDDTKIQIISDESIIPDHDYHVFLLSLPKIYYQNNKKLLPQINFIKKNEIKFTKWKKKLAVTKLPRIGINWQGGQAYKADRYRSIPLICFEPLFNINELAFINLQKGFGEEQIKNFKYKDKLYNFSSIVDIGQNSFEDTVEIIRNLDLVITPDTAIAHLSSSIDIKTWILISYSPDWRWFLDKKDTPWYRNTKLFRQKKLNDWSQVFEEVRGELIKEFQI